MNNNIINTDYIDIDFKTDEIKYLNAVEEENYKIAHGATEYDDKGKIIKEELEVRVNGEPSLVRRDEVDFIDVSANQAFSVAPSNNIFSNPSLLNILSGSSNISFIL